MYQNYTQLLSCIGCITVVMYWVHRTAVMYQNYTQLLSCIGCITVVMYWVHRTAVMYQNYTQLMSFIGSTQLMSFTGSTQLMPVKLLGQHSCCRVLGFIECFSFTGFCTTSGMFGGLPSVELLAFTEFGTTAVKYWVCITSVMHSVNTTAAVACWVSVAADMRIILYTTIHTACISPEQFRDTTELFYKS